MVVYIILGTGYDETPECMMAVTFALMFVKGGLIQLCLTFSKADVARTTYWHKAVRYRYLIARLVQVQ